MPREPLSNMGIEETADSEARGVHLLTATPCHQRDPISVFISARLEFPHSLPIVKIDRL